MKYLKPALKRNTLHLRNNVIVGWKSFEIWVIQQGVDLASSKILNPLYVPMEEATKMLSSMTIAQIETHIVNCLKPNATGKQFEYVSQAL